MSQANATIYNLTLFGIFHPEKAVTNFVSLQVQGCTVTDEDTYRAEPQEDATIWSVYGRGADGMAKGIADFPKDQQLLCWLFAAHLSHVMGIPIEGAQFNLSSLEAAVYNLNNAVPN